jgi:hypothetical protein
MIWNIVNQPYAPELWIAGIWITEVAIARNKSTQFVFFRKKDRQSGNEIMNRKMISNANTAVATVSVTFRSVSAEGLMVAVLSAWMVKSAAIRAIQMIFVCSYQRCAFDSGRVLELFCWKLLIHQPNSTRIYLCCLDENALFLVSSLVIWNEEVMTAMTKFTSQNVKTTIPIMKTTY